MMRMIVLAACVMLAGCASTTYSGGPSSKGIVYGVDANGNALRRQPGEPPPRASAAQMCMNPKSCNEEDNE
jgi:hypothetical protein